MESTHGNLWWSQRVKLDWKSFGGYSFPTGRVGLMAVCRVLRGHWYLRYPSLQAATISWKDPFITNKMLQSFFSSRRTDALSKYDISIFTSWQESLTCAARRTSLWGRLPSSNLAVVGYQPAASVGFATGDLPFRIINLLNVSDRLRAL